MELNLGLLHEGDLFTLLNYIDKKAEGSYTISECTFNKAGGQIVFEKNQTNITAACVLNWLTIDLANGNRIEI